MLTRLKPFDYWINNWATNNLDKYSKVVMKIIFTILFSLVFFSIHFCRRRSLKESKFPQKNGNNIEFISLIALIFYEVIERSSSKS